MGHLVQVFALEASGEPLDTTTVSHSTGANAEGVLSWKHANARRPGLP